MTKPSEREDRKNKLQWWFGQEEILRTKCLIECEPTSPALTCQHFQESRYNSWMCLCEGILCEGLEEVMDSISSTGKGCKGK